MTKIQKIWLSIFIAMFALPEILWSPVINLIYEFLQNTNKVQPWRDNFLMNSDNIAWLSVIYLIQLVGLLGCLMLIISLKPKNIAMWLVNSVLIICSLTVAFLLFASLTIGGHGIGF